MTNKEAIEVIFTEFKCIDRNDGINCDRKCEDCDLVLPIERIRDAYNLAISALEAQDVPDINVGDMISRADAIGDLHGKDPSQIWDTADIEVWVNALPSAQPEQTACAYCNEDSDGFVKPIEKNCHAFVQFGMNGWVLDLNAKGWHGEGKINYCPMCGRRLVNG